MVLETLVLFTFNHLTRLVARDNFIILSRRESLKSYIIEQLTNLNFLGCKMGSRRNINYEVQNR
jgi:hypothetical protein